MSQGLGAESPYTTLLPPRRLFSTASGFSSFFIQWLVVITALILLVLPFGTFAKLSPPKGLEAGNEPGI